VRNRECWLELFALARRTQGRCKISFGALAQEKVRIPSDGSQRVP
jgi:hypothetical protein